MAAIGVYGLRTLQDNWYEDRCQSASGMPTTATGGFEHRRPRAYESDIAYIGERYDVLNRISRMPDKKSYAICDDGFRERQSTHHADFAPPKTRTEFVRNPPAKPAMITAESVPEVSYDERRPLPFKHPRFAYARDERLWNTTHGDFFGYAASQRCEPRCFITGEMGSSGISSEAEESRVSGVKVGKLCGEKFNETDDPGVNTHTQRAWLYQSDPALKYSHLGGSRVRPLNPDNELSLPIGDGAMAKVRADLMERKGRLYRTATTITKGLGQRGGISIFQDG